jgi:methylmalonyl-CoA mutase N-terminal domain/subunit
VEACTYDEPVCIPTHEARELATRTQQILAHEVGAARTADPLGGSYYVEALTDAVEAEALKLLGTIEERGLVKSVRDGFLESMMDEHNYTHEREMASGERIKVGVNRFQPEQDEAPPRFQVNEQNVERHVQRFVELKRTRDQDALARRIADVYAITRRGDNPTEAMMDALIADGSMGEVWGTVRMAMGHPYDPFRVLESPWEHNS